jgi:hypothetical protein
MTPTPIDQLRAYLASVISRASEAKVPDGYADGVDPKGSEFVTDLSVYVADRVLDALWDGGLEPGKIAEFLHLGPTKAEIVIAPRK